MRPLSQIQNKALTVKEAAVVAALVHEEVALREFSMCGFAGPLFWVVLNDLLIIGGSNGLGDWVSNLDCLPGPEGAHRGFLRLARLISKVVDLTAIKGVVGYSQGAGVAQALGCLWEKPLRMVLFAAPRVLTAKRASCYPHHVLRYYIKPDVAAILPPWFVHVGKEFSKKGSTLNFWRNHTHILYEYYRI